MMHQLIWVFASFGGAMLTYFFQRIGLNVVVASCCVGLLGALLSYLLKMPHLAYVIFAGSFVGMTSPKVGGYGFVVIASIFCGIVYGQSLKLFEGFGGKLGATAFVSSVSTHYLLSVLKKVLKWKLLK